MEAAFVFVVEVAPASAFAGERAVWKWHGKAAAARWLPESCRQ
jgi:hypothetical protein